ncbi:hypothetical protein C0991_003748 [Blastosporella zonata]|nr:hypothetical protein C0991_003748 [Blastosporella zonata]
MSLKFWKPGTAGPGSTLDRATEVEGNVVPSAPAYSQRERLPIFKHREKLLYSIETHGVIIVVGQTGCGKTTQLPQYLYEAGWAAEGSVIACTQPRRVAATSVATRVASEVGTTLGNEVGYTIRFEDVSDKERTRILYMTDGMLFREALVDPLLSRYSAIMIDEAHERSVYTDLLLGVLKKIRRKRPSLRLIVSSATLDATAFLEYFTDSATPNDAIIASVTIDGIKYVVDCGFVKIRTYNPTTALASLSTVPTSVASATQRAGRAGRTSSGICYRLYPLSVFESLPYSTPAEVTRVDMTTPILQLKSLGIDDLMKFEWVSAPPAEIVLRALEGLVAAGMIGEDGRLTPMGSQVAECPVEVGIARMASPPLIP